MKVENYVTLEFLSRSTNEAFARDCRGSLCRAAGSYAGRGGGYQNRRQ